jgi:hypothetical protein
MRAVRTHYVPTGLQAMPSEGRHSWHSGAYLPLLSYPGRATISDETTTGRVEQPEDGPSRRRRRHPRDSQESAVGRMEQLADVGRSGPAESGLNDHATFGSGPTLVYTSCVVCGETTPSSRLVGAAL